MAFLRLPASRQDEGSRDAQPRHARPAQPSASKCGRRPFVLSARAVRQNALFVSWTSGVCRNPSRRPPKRLLSPASLGSTASRVHHTRSPRVVLYMMHLAASVAGQGFVVVDRGHHAVPRRPNLRSPYRSHLNLLAAATSDRNIHLLDRSTLKVMRMMEGAHGDRINELAFAPGSEPRLVLVR